jgi:hypothetical protein
LIDRHVAAARPAGNVLVYAALDDARKTVRVHYGEGRPITAFRLVDGAFGFTFLGHDEWDANSLGLMAMNTQSHLWQLIKDQQSYLLAPPPGSTVVGLVHIPRLAVKRNRVTIDNYTQPSLVLLEENKKQVTLLNPKGLHKLFSLTDSISKIEVDQQHHLIGVIDSNRVIKVFSIKHMNFLMEILPGFK